MCDRKAIRSMKKALIQIYLEGYAVQRKMPVEVCKRHKMFKLYSMYVGNMDDEEVKKNYNSSRYSFNSNVVSSTSGNCKGGN